MEQEVAVNKVLRDLKMGGYIGEDSSGDVRVIIDALWVAGYEYKTKELGYKSRKKIIQYDAEGNEIGRFEGIKVASRKIKCDNLTIERAIKSGKLTRKRHYWKLTEDEKV